MQNNEKIAARISAGETYLGIEFGSTRIKAVLIDDDHNPIAGGSHSWENRFEDKVWTYSQGDILEGLRACYSELAQDVLSKYGLVLKSVGAMGISGMMHGYLALDHKGEPLVPFRTWRNTMTARASKELTELLAYNIPERWSIAHLYQAILNDEAHVRDIAYITTIAGYLHWLLTDKKVIGVGDASGIFPINTETVQFDNKMLSAFGALVSSKGYPWEIEGILPEVLVAGDNAGRLTEYGARLIDPTGMLEAGIPFCPPEGDAGTGMVATNSVKLRTGNISAGTSIFAMVVLERQLSRVYQKIDMVTTPSGELVAMVHCNNCTGELDAWIRLFEEVLQLGSSKLNTDELFVLLYKKALEGESDCDGLMAINYFSGEPVTGFAEGRPLFVRSPSSNMNLGNFMRVQLFSALASLKLGMDILFVDEKVELDNIFGHGGFFKTPEVGQRIAAAALNTPISVMSTAGEGGPWGMAVLAQYMIKKSTDEKLSDYLDAKVFGGSQGIKIKPQAQDVAGFEAFMSRYINGLEIEKAAIEYL